MLFGCFAKWVITAAFFVNTTFKTAKIQYVFRALAYIGRIFPNIIICVLSIEKHWQHLPVMDIGRGPQTPELIQSLSQAGLSGLPACVS
jgi:hypothetical protein